MDITLQTPKVYQYSETGRPDEGLEVYIWPNGDIDTYFNGRSTPHEISMLGFVCFLGHNLPMDYFDLTDNTFSNLTTTLEEVNNGQAN